MNCETIEIDDAGGTNKIERRLLRDGQAQTMSAVFTGIHFFAVLVVRYWYLTVAYSFVPLWKQECDRAGTVLSTNRKLFILQADFLDNYWYVLAFPLAALLIADFHFMRWMGEEISLRRVLIFGSVVTMILLISPALGLYTFL